MSIVLNHNSPKPRVTIVGAGAIGLSIGWRLGQKGLAVDIFDAGLCGREASWAAAGMLAAQIETEPTEEGLLPLARESQALWPEFALELQQLTGIDVGYRGEGTIMVALTRDDHERLRVTHDFHRRMGLDISWLSAAAVLAREPALNPRIAGGLWSAADGQVDNRQVVAALIAACRSVGCRVHENTAVAGLSVNAGRVDGVHLSADGHEGRFHAAEIVVMAAGAWTRGIEGMPKTSAIPVRPVKGQMLALKMNAEAPLLTHVVWGPNVYLVPRRDGRLIVGATTEERGFDRSLTAGGMLALLEGAWRLLPGVEELPIDEFWCGFRPGSRDDMPILGETEIEGVIVATGHHRNGILLTPVTARAISQMIVTGKIDPLIGPFGIDRFKNNGVKQ